jgi:hypothetical protein
MMDFSIANVSSLSLLCLAALGCAGPVEDQKSVETEVVDRDQDGFDADSDCDDGDPTVFPGADELCNQRDDDCDGLADEDPVDGIESYVDNDGDGYGSGDPILACSVAAPLVAVGGDCDDGDATVNPEAYDAPGDGMDRDCDGEDAVTAACATDWPHFGDVTIEGVGAQQALTDICLDNNRLVGDLIVRDTDLIQLDLDCLCTIDGDLIVELNADLTAIYDANPSGDFVLIDDPLLAVVDGSPLQFGGDVWVEDVPMLPGLDGYGIAGDLHWSTSSGAALDVVFPDLSDVGGDLIIGPLPVDTHLEFNALTAIEGSFRLEDIGGVSTLNFSSLRTIGGDLRFTRLDGVEVVIPGLRAVGGSLALTDSANLTLQIVEQYLGSISVGQDLVISGLEATPALPMRARTVGGDVRIEDNDDLIEVTDLELLTVGGDLLIEGNRALEYLDSSAVGDLELGGSLIVRANHPTATLTLPLIVGTVPGDVEIEGNWVRFLDAVEGIQGNLRLLGTSGNWLNFASLTTVGGDVELLVGTSRFGAPNLVDIGGDFRVERTTLTSLSMPGLESIGGTLEFTFNDDLAVFSLGGLTAAGGIDADDNPALTSLSVPQLTTTGILRLSDSPLLVSLTDLGALQQLESLTLTTGGLTDISALSGATVSESIYIGETALTSLAGLESVSVVNGSFEIKYTQLTDLVGLGGLTEVGHLTLMGNDTLASLDGMSGLVTASQLTIFDNDVLVDLTAPLGTLNSVNTLEIQYNASLLTADAQAFADAIPNTIAVIINDNAP